MKVIKTLEALDRVRGMADSFVDVYSTLLEAHNENEAELRHERELRVDRDATIGKLIAQCKALEAENANDEKIMQALREAAKAARYALFEQHDRADRAESKLETANADLARGFKDYEAERARLAEACHRADGLERDLEESREETARAKRAIESMHRSLRATCECVGVTDGASWPALNAAIGKLANASAPVPAAPAIIDQGAQVEQLRAALKASEDEEKRLRHQLSTVVGEWQGKVRALAAELQQIKTAGAKIDALQLLAEVERRSAKRERGHSWKAERKRLRQALWQVTQHRDELQRAAGTDTATVNARIDEFAKRYHDEHARAEAAALALAEARKVYEAGALEKASRICALESDRTALSKSLDEAVLLGKNALAVVDARDRATARAVQAEGQIHDLANRMTIAEKQSRIFARAADTEKAEATAWRHEVDRLRHLLDEALGGWAKLAGHVDGSLGARDRQAVDEIRTRAETVREHVFDTAGAPTVIWARPARRLNNSATSVMGGDAVQYQAKDADGRMLIAVELPPNCRVVSAVTAPEVIGDFSDEREPGTTLYTQEQLEGSKP